MTIRVWHTINVFISDDTEGLYPLYGIQDPDKSLVKVDAFERYTSGKLQIAASGTENLPFGDVSTVRGFMIDADRGFDIVFNGGGDTIEVRPAVASSGTTIGSRARIFMEVGTLTQLAITNADATTALDAKYVVWGDVTP